MAGRKAQERRRRANKDSGTKARSRKQIEKDRQNAGLSQHLERVHSKV